MPREKGFTCALALSRAVHCKSLAAQEVRALLAARKLIQGKLHDISGASCAASASRSGRRRGALAPGASARIRPWERRYGTAEIERKPRAIGRRDDNAQRLDSS
ncbi:hypothetical protein FQZ97_632630 [compost metagenome]